MPLFGKPKSTGVPGQSSATALVLQMRAQGIPNSQIIQNLQSQGFSPQDVFDAMNQADMKTGVEGPDNFNPEGVENPMPQRFQPYPQPQIPQNPGQAPGQTGGQAVIPSVPSDFGGIGGEQIEELVEAIIEEKWNELVKNINKIIEWKNKVDTRLTQIEQDIKNMRSDFTELQKSIIGKIGEYDQNITNVGTEIKAMEKVFQKVLPTFTESVNELSRLTDDLKGVGAGASNSIGGSGGSKTSGSASSASRGKTEEQKKGLMERM